MTQMVDASTTQRRDVAAIVADDVERQPLGPGMVIPDGFDSLIRLLVHDDAVAPASGPLSHALVGTPSISSSDGRVTCLSGAMQVSGSLAAALCEAIKLYELTLWVPHAFASPEHVASLQDDQLGHVVAIGEHVYMAHRGPAADPEQIRRALASTIGCYSVAWLVSEASGHRVARLAIVPIFDGDGFALVGPMSPAGTP